MAQELRRQKVSRRKAVAILGSGVFGTALTSARRSEGQATDTMCTEKASISKPPPHMIASACCKDVIDLIKAGHPRLSEKAEQDRLQPLVDEVKGLSSLPEHCLIIFDLNKAQVATLTKTVMDALSK